MSNNDHNSPNGEPASKATSTGATAVQNDLRDIVQTITTQLRGEERLHAGVLQQMQDRLATLGAEAHIARYNVPEAYRPALQNIKNGLSQLSQRVAEAGGDHATPAAPLPETAVEAPVALMSATTPSDITEASQVGAGQLPSESNFDPFDVVGSSEAEEDDPNNPWDAVSADALARIYETGEAGYTGPMPDPDAPSFSTVPAHEEIVGSPKPSSLASADEIEFGTESTDDASQFDGDLEDEFDLAVEASSGVDFDNTADELTNAAPAPMSFDDPPPVFASAQAEGAAPSTVPEKEWLEDRFAEIARRIEDNSGSSAGGAALNSLTLRLDKLEEGFSAAIQDVATRSDVGGLRIVEAQINEINTHLEEAQSKFVKLDSIEGQLTAVMERLSDEHLGEFVGMSGNLSPEIVEEVAIAAAEKAAMRLAAIDQSAMPGTQHEMMADLQHALHGFMDERRQGEIESQSILETMQQAMIRVLDRVDAIELGVHQTAQPVQQPPMMQAHVADLVPPASELPPMGEAQDFETPSTAEGYEARLEDLATPHMPETPLPFSEQAFDEHGVPPGYEAEVSISKDPSSMQDDPAVSPFSMVPGETDYDDDPISELGDLPQSPPRPEIPAVSVPEMDLPPPTVADTGPDFDEPEALKAAPAIGEPLPPREKPKAQRDSSIQQMRENLRVRQEQIANEQRAKLDAAANEGRAMDAAKEKKGGLGLSFLRKSKSGAGAPDDANDDVPAKSGGLFGLTKRKLIVNMFVAMCTIPAIALVMDLPLGMDLLAGKKGDRAIVSTTPGDDDKNAVAGTRSYKDDVIDPANVRPGVKPGTPATDGQARRAAMADDSYKGQIVDDAAAANLLASSFVDRPPAGMTIYDSGRKLTQHQVNRLQEREDLATRSVKLGKYAVPATPASLSNEDDEAAEKTEQRKPLIKGGARRALGLAPAKVGPLSLRLAAAKGNPSAQFQVATRLAQGRGNAQDYAEAANWFKRSAQQGFAQSQYRLGTLYERGLGVSKDTSRAQTWYRRAAEQGSMKAMHNLAVLSANPIGKSPDYTTAAHWFSGASDRGLADSQFNLAVLYENGLGVPKDLQQAYKYFVLAAKGGDAEAGRRRDAVIAKLDTAELASAETLVRRFRRKKSDRIVNDAHAAGQAWKNNSAGANYIN